MMATEKTPSRKSNPTAVEVGRLIREGRERLGTSQAKFARQLGIKQPSLSNIEKGETIHTKHLPAIEVGLGFEPGTLTARFSGTIAKAVNFDKGNAKLSGVRDFPVYYMQRATENGAGYVLSGEPIEFVDRPPLLSAARDSFGICVYGNEMSPAYDPGDIIFVNPYRPPVIGADVVVRPTDLDDARAVIGKLRQDTPDELHLFQHRDARTVKLKKAEWGRVATIDGKYNRR